MSILMSIAFNHFPHTLILNNYSSVPLLVSSLLYWVLSVKLMSSIAFNHFPHILILNNFSSVDLSCGYVN
jgi:hypothetical protein